MSDKSSTKKLDIFYEEFSSLLGIDKSLISNDLKLIDLDWDSMALISTMALIDEVFGIVISGDELTKCKTFGDIYSLIKD